MMKARNFYNMDSKKIGQYTFLTGIILLLIAYFLPISGEHALKPLGLCTIFICPALGLLGAGFSIKHREWGYALLNFLLIMSFPLLMWIGYLLLGP